ncbi:MAK10-like protein [Tanacetum coccineum]|uniref:MAK10-like protein n=1 Tax=Tanacetum coccineum TaxID=301880 RepID=A0ABQ5C2E2_9ASTR
MLISTGIWSEMPNQTIKDFLKLVDSLDLDGENKERTRLCLFQFSLRGQASNWLERLPAGSITTWEDLTTRFLAQFFPPGRTAKLRNDILIWNDPRDFAKPVKAITLPQDVPSTSDRRLIELENQVQRLMEAHLAPMQPTQVNKITTSCEICSGPYDTQYCMEDPEQAFVGYASSCTDEAGEGLVSNFMASQDARLSKFEANFKQQQSEMNNKIDTVFKAITDQLAGPLPSDTVKNSKLSTSPVLSACSYPTEEPQCSTHIHGSINTITIHPKQQNDSRDSMAKAEEQERKGDPEDTNTIAYIEERRDTSLLERKDITDVGNLGSNKDDEGIEWLDVKEPLDLVDTSEESVYELLIKEMPKCLLNYDFRIKKDDLRNLKIPCMIGHKFTANAY